MIYKNGSEWRKWDLHIHTPCSLVQEYGQDDDATWEKFIADLEALPREFKVIGINDYIFIDGYKKVLAAKNSGRLSNLELILPVIELRLDKFGGSESKLSRVNFHVIFSDELEPDVIEHQFLSALSSSYQLSPKYAAKGISWKGVPNRPGLTDLGEKIIASVPPEERSKFDSPLKEGFFNLNLSLPDIQKILAGSYFKDKTLTAVGKTEWGDIKWNDQSIADKKMIINSADLVFTSASSPDTCIAARAKLTGAGVNDRLLDCSDAHRFSASGEKDRIGKCFTWIKADPTFSGLRHAIHESAGRIFVGNTPPQVLAVRATPTKFIHSLKMFKTNGSTLDETWFDGVDMSFGTGLVAIIGKKGSGKSALADILGLLSNSNLHGNASFLNKDRFNPSKNPKGAHFEGVLKWHDGISEQKLLNEVPDSSAVPRAKYISQHFFEKVCNEIASGQSTAFDEEIKDVIFSHVPPDARLSQSSLNELVSYRTSEVGRALSVLQERLRQINREIVEMQSRSSEEYRSSQAKHLEAKQAELAAHQANRPAEVSKPGEAGDDDVRRGAAKIEAANKRLAEVDKQIADAKVTHKRLALQISISQRATQKIDGIRQQMLPLIAAVEKDLGLLGIPTESVIQLMADGVPIQAKEAELRQDKLNVDGLLDESGPTSLLQIRESILAEIATTQAELDEPGKLHQAYLHTLRLWEEKGANIVGSQEIPGSLRYYEAVLDRLGDLPINIEERKTERLTIVKEIYAKIVEMKAVYEDLYRPVQKFIDGHSIAKQQFRLNFDVEIADTGFSEGFFGYINQQVSGSFCGKGPGEEHLADILERHDFDTEQGAISFALEIEHSLTNNVRKSSPEAVLLTTQMRKGASPEAVYDYVFGLGYLAPKYGLQMAGKSLDRLSPGEKGSLLLVFYLLVDRNDTPLIMDQPEENLDNETIVSLLVPSVKEAKERRQIFVVTHSPNIAVVCDAEQIICATHEQNDKNRITYLGGSIESPEINKKIMDVLEGTKPAFDNRSMKYR